VWFLEYLWVIWVLSSLSFIRYYAYVVAYVRRLVAKPAQTKFNTPQVLFQVTTKGNVPIVQETVNRVHNVCQRIGYTKYDMWVVTDAQEEFANCRTMVVPSSFECNADFKGRALQYAVDVRAKETRNTEELYIFHLDDESLITKQTLCSILTYLEDKPAPISEGLVIYPVREKDRVTASNLLDTFRPFCCFECVSFMSKGNPAYIHGSNLLVRSDIEQSVGWNNGKTITEDTLFATSAKKKYGPGVFGWHGGMVEEASPFSLGDSFRQRRRWFYGLLQNMKYLGFKDRVWQSIRGLIWSSGFLSGLISLVAVFVPQQIPLPLRIVFLITSGLWLLSYQIGAFFNGKYLSKWRRVEFHLVTLVSTPVLGLIECAMPILAVLKRPKTFEVVKK
jgi:beta-1,4-mannosyltransferase